MNQCNGSFGKAAAAVLLAVAGFTLASTTIDPTASRATDADGVAAHSWLAAAFPTGQATLARSGVHGS